MSFAEGIEHGLERRDAGFVHEAAAVIAGAADSADAEPRRCNRIDLTVAMARYEHIDPMLHFSCDRREQVLAVPERQDDRHVGFAALVHILRLEYEARRCSDQSEIFGRGNPDGRFNPSLPRNVPP
jgi:hypothetical protein